MAQFGKQFFGASFFGKSNSFIGTYDTRMIDAVNTFDGAIKISIISKLPSSLYSHKDELFNYSGGYTVGADKTTLSNTGVITSYVSGKDLIIKHGEGKSTVEVTEEETQTTKTFTTDSSGELKLENFPDNELRNYGIKITTDTSFEFQGIEVQTTEIQAMVRATTEELGRSEYFLKGDWPLAYQTEAMVEHDTYWKYHEEVNLTYSNGILEGETSEFLGVRYIQTKLILLTTEENDTPSVQEIHFYSGDLSKFSGKGLWKAVLDMNNIADNSGVNFRRVKNMEWVEEEYEGSTFDIHSSSKNGSTPSNINISDDTYWSDLTAKYRLKHDGVVPGVPFGRISLKQKGNGQDVSSNLGSVMFGPINTLSFGFTNTEITEWSYYEGVNYYPRNSSSSSIQIEFYENKKDIEEGIPPLSIITNPKAYQQELLSISSEYDNIYARILFERPAGIQSPVVDRFDILANLRYDSSRNSHNYKDVLSALDGEERNNQIGKGKKLLRTIQNREFDWPTTVQERKENKEYIENSVKRVVVEYNQKYLNQVFVGINDSDVQEVAFTNEYPSEYKIISQVYAKEPKASINEVDKNTLYYHYNYDGGTVNFPITTTRNLSTQYTPSLLSNKEYRFKIENGWSNQLFKIPETMTLEEVADIASSTVEDLLEINENLPLYNNKVLVGYEIVLPNNSYNELVNFEFQESGDVVTNYSLLNNKENDVIKAWIDESSNYKYTTWTSEERIFDGVINYNDENQPYVRVQNSSYNVQQKGNHTVSKSEETALEIASRYSVDVEDLLLLNNKREVFKRNEIVIIPGGYSLPDIKEGLIYEGDHPYKIEIIPGSVRREKGNVRLPNDVLIPGTTDENAISYTLTESETETVFIERGNVANGRDRIPLSNVIKVESVVNQTDSTKYIKATDTMGDYIVKDGYIDWSPAFKESKEPAPGTVYAVTLTRGVVDTLRIIYSSNYTEKMSQDRMEAIPVIENKEYAFDLSEDRIVQLESLESMQIKYPNLKNLRYISENSDLWVNTYPEGDTIRVSLNGEDPNINWYPKINTGFYYLNDKEYYLYSRPIETVFDDKDIPVIKDVEYTEEGLKAPNKE